MWLDVLVNGSIWWGNGIDFNIRLYFLFIGLNKPDLKLGVCLACDSAVCLTDASLDPLCVFLWPFTAAL